MNPTNSSVLIVDDVPKNIQLLGSILKNESIEIEFATSGKEALEWLNSKPFNKSELIARVRTHLTLQRQKKMLEENNALKDKVFSIIGHDLRNPVGNIKTYIDAFLISGMEVSDDVKMLLKDISIPSEQAFALLENLLLWAKNQSGILTCKPARTDLTE